MIALAFLLNIYYNKMARASIALVAATRADRTGPDRTGAPLLFLDVLAVFTTAQALNLNS